MRFISLVKSIEGIAGKPPKALMDAMDQLVQEAGKTGCVMVEGIGLHPTSAGARDRIPWESRSRHAPENQARRARPRSRSSPRR